ncbi:WD40 repeat domain-containing protein [Alteromonadaceae bacterium M269]|nr:WD40 repeat domain-containing protein [Alteromonadaceae bacterium M269]
MKHIAPISGVASIAEKYVATAGYDNQVLLWNAKTHVAFARVHHDHLANQCTFSDNGHFLASASSDYSARIWEIPSLRLKAVLTGHNDDVEMVAFSPDSTQIATCSRDHLIRVFDLNGILSRTYEGHQADVISVTWNPEGTELISSSDDGTVRRWSVDSGKELSCIELDDVETDTLVITRNGEIIAGDDEGRITIIQTDGSVETIAAHNAGIKRLVYSQATGRLVSLSYDRTMKIWLGENQSLTELSTADLPALIWPRSCAFLDDHTIVFATFGSTYSKYDTNTQCWSTPNYEPSLSINSVTRNNNAIYTVGDSGIVRSDNTDLADMNGLCNFIVPCGSRLISGGQMGVVHDAQTGEAIYTHRSPLNCGCDFEIDGIPYAAIGSYTGEIILVKEQGGKLQYVKCIDMHKNAIKGLASDGKTIMGVSADRATAIINISTLAVTSYWEDGHTQIANGCATLGAGQYCSISRDLKLRIWQEDGCSDTIDTPNKNSLKCVAASDSFIAVGDYGGRICIYNRQQSLWLDTVRPTTWGISSMYNDSSDTFLASSYDGNIYQIKINEGKAESQVILPVVQPISLAKAG